MRGLMLALQFLTRLPLPVNTGFSPEALSRSARWFPVAGLVVGACVAGAAALGARLDPWLGALSGLIVWVWITGALHLDGLADSADALGAAHRDPQRLLAVLADPHVGAFGVVALGLQLIAKTVLLMLLAREGAFWALALIPAWARWGVLPWSRLPPLKPGLGERFAWKTASWEAGLGFAALAAASLALAPALLAAPLAILAWHRFLRHRLGGMTGDLLGAGIELVESVALLAVVIAAARAVF